MIHVVIADDHAVVRTGLQFIFDTTSDIVLAAECRNGEELLKRVKEQNFDLVILDITMPGTDAFMVMEQLKSLYPSLPVIVFTMNSDKSFALRMFKKGANAFINKETDPDILLKAIRTVAQGKKYQTPEQIELLLDHISENKNNHTERHEVLTDREFQMLCMLASGMKKSDIAGNLNISKNTVSNHRNNLMKKMEFESNAELTRYAVTNNLIG